MTSAAPISHAAIAHCIHPDRLRPRGDALARFGLSLSDDEVVKGLAMPEGDNASRSVIEWRVSRDTALAGKRRAMLASFA
jgi:hypothetical protein